MKNKQKAVVKIPRIEVYLSFYNFSKLVKIPRCEVFLSR
jgi:hypothetical protein